MTDMITSLKTALQEKSDDIIDLALQFKQELGDPAQPSVLPENIMPGSHYNFENYEEDDIGNGYIQYCPKLKNAKKKAISINGDGDCLFSVSYVFLFKMKVFCLKTYCHA